MHERIMVVEDEEDIQVLLKYILESEGYKVTVCSDGMEALSSVHQEPPDLMLLDIMLPKVDGKEVCRIVRREHDFPIIMLSAKSDELDKVIGLEVGADDYMAKPFGKLELTARIRAALRRSNPETSVDRDILKCGDLVMDRARHTVKINDQLIDLRPKEFALLEVLLANKGRVLDRDTLLERIWGDEDYVDPGTVDVNIRRLRMRLEEQPDRPKYVTTVRGIGYRLSDA